jgi:DNA-binding IclR family transcriptional regulator
MQTGGAWMAAPLNGVVKSADRVLDLFELLSTWGHDMSHAAIAERLAIPKSSLTPLLRNLVSRGFVEYDHVTKGYRLGPTFVCLAQRAGDQHSMLERVQPILDELSKATGESCMANRLAGDEAQIVISVIGPQRLVSHMRVGDRGPLYALSGGKAILASLPEEMREDYFARVKFEKILPDTIDSVDDLRRELAEISRSGIAYSLQEFTIGIAGMSSAVLADDGYPAGAISVVMPAIRFNEGESARIGRLLRDAAARAGRALRASERFDAIRQA